MLIKKEYVWIYNKLQSDFYFIKGIIPISIGVGTKGDTYIKFRNTEKLEEAFTQWCLRKYD